MIVTRVKRGICRNCKLEGKGIKIDLIYDSFFLCHHCSKKLEKAINISNFSNKKDLKIEIDNSGTYRDNL